MRRLARDKLALAALVFTLAIVAAALLAPWIVAGDPYDNDLGSAMAPPGAEHLLGADDQGRDLVVRLVYGLRVTLLMGALSVLAGGGVGVLLGLLAAFYRPIDGLVMRCMDVLLSFPAILFGLAIAAIFGPGIQAVVLAMAVATVPLTARIARAAAVVEMGARLHGGGAGDGYAGSSSDPGVSAAELSVGAGGVGPPCASAR